MSYRTIQETKVVYICEKCIFCSNEESEGVNHQLNTGHIVRRIFEDETTPKIPLRKCKDCGKEAFNKEDLKLFVPRKGNQCKYGRKNDCTQCNNKRSTRRYAEKKRILKNLLV